MAEFFTPNKLSPSVANRGTMQRVIDLDRDMVHLCATLALESDMPFFKTYNWNDIKEASVHTKILRELSKVKHAACRVLPFNLEIMETFQAHPKKVPNWNSQSVGYYFAFDYCRRVLGEEKLQEDAPVAYFETHKREKRQKNGRRLREGGVECALPPRETSDVSGEEKRAHTMERDRFRVERKRFARAWECDRRRAGAPRHRNVADRPDRNCNRASDMSRIPQEAQNPQWGKHRAFFFDSNNGSRRRGVWEHMMFPSERHAMVHCPYH